MTTCDSCPFKTACPLKRKGHKRCIVGRHPTRFYVFFWALASISGALGGVAY